MNEHVLTKHTVREFSDVEKMKRFFPCITALSIVSTFVLNTLTVK